MKRVIHFIPFILFFISFSSFGQNNIIKCATESAMEQFYLQTPEKKAEYLRTLSEFNEVARIQKNQKSLTTFIIPTVVHVIHFNGNGNVSDAQVIDGIDQINEDLKRLNSDTNLTRSIFKPYAGSIDVEFRLAKKDPNGNCTNGIDRVNSATTNNFGGTDVNISKWNNLNNPGQNQYFNIWLVNDIENFTGGGGVILGYAYYPLGSSNSLYGVVNRNDAWGRVGNILYQGRTATHEVGHALNLPHTFDGACGNDCNSSGDFVCDTPPASSATQGCNTNLNSCNNDTIGTGALPSDFKNQLENYMSYDDCQNMFSAGQVSRMTTALNTTSILSGLTNTQNVINTGTDDAYYFSAPPCAPTAEFSVDKKFNCVNGAFNFEDFSYNGIKDSTWTYSWSFPGGTPNSSTDEKPTIAYNQAGQYDVSLTVTNNQGTSMTETKTNYVNVIEGSGNFIAPIKIFFTESGFPNYPNDPSLSWEIRNQNNSAFTWERTNAAFFSGPASVRLRNFNISANGQKNSLISPVANLTQLNNAYLNFRIAYAQRANEVELINILYSPDCGSTWALLKSELSINLYTAPKVNNSEFVPMGPEDWEPYSLDISNLAGKDNLKFRLEFKSLGGNNIYIDDFEISESPLTGIDNGFELGNSFEVYPNPSNGIVTIKFNQEESEEFKIVNMLGQVLETFNMAKEESKEIDLTHLESGLYFIQSVNNRSINKKLIIE